MLYIICTLLGFAAGVYIYRLGIQDGIAVEKGKQVTVVNPIASTFSAINSVSFKPKEDTKAKDLYAEGLANLLNYDGKEQKGGDAR
jgi:hypothetical protein